MSENAQKIMLHDDQDPSLLTEAGVLHKTLTKNFGKVLEKAALNALMGSYQARLMASCSTDATRGAEAQAYHMIAHAHLDAAEDAGAECRSIDRLDRIARRKLRTVYKKHLENLENIARKATEPTDTGSNRYGLGGDIWAAQTMLHLLDEPV